MSNLVERKAPSSSTQESAKIKPLQEVQKLLHWDDLPHWLQDNAYIHTHYRLPSNSFSGSISSLFYLHNETVNVYSHLLPATLSIPTSYFLYQALRLRYGSATLEDLIAFGCFFLGFALCLGMSATYHLISNHSPRVNRLGNQLDYVGIVLLIAGSFVPSVYYGFWCKKELQMGYWTMICSLGAVCGAVSVLPRFRTPAWRPFRASMFVGLGLSAVFPVIHGLVLYGPIQMEKQIGLSWVVLQGFAYIVGACVYAARIPERLSPGKYDVLGSSHQIFHFLVVAAALSHLTGLLKAFDYRHGLSKQTCP